MHCVPHVSTNYIHSSGLHSPTFIFISSLDFYVSELCISFGYSECREHGLSGYGSFSYTETWPCACWFSNCHKSQVSVVSKNISCVFHWLWLWSTHSQETSSINSNTHYKGNFSKYLRPFGGQWVQELMLVLWARPLPSFWELKETMTKNK